MTWICRFTKDVDKNDIGSATAEYQDGEGNVEFSFSRRINGKDQAVKFVQAAKAAKVQFEADETRNNVIATAIATKLNAE